MKLALLTFLISASAFGAIREFQTRWQTCQRADECVQIKGVCGQCQAVNANYKNAASLHFRQKKLATAVCTQKFPKLENVVCFYNKCSCHR